MAKAYDIKNSSQVSKLLGSTKGERIEQKQPDGRAGGAVGAALDYGQPSRNPIQAALADDFGGVQRSPIQMALDNNPFDPKPISASSLHSALDSFTNGPFGPGTPPRAAPPPPGWTGPSTAGSSFAPYMNADTTQPGMGEDFISQNLGAFTGPTNAQGFYDQGSFNTPTASEGFYQQNAGQFAAPGAAENWFAQNQGQFNTPGAAEDFYRAHQGDLANMPDPTNRAEEAYQASKGRRPDIAKEAGLEPYYNEAEARGTRQLNKRAAAMGNYGSSVAMGEVGNLVTGLEAEMANRKADYDLRRIAEQRAWEQLGGEMASSADRSSLGVSQNELSQLLGMGNLAQAAQQGSLSRLLGAAGASQGAQAAQTSRLNAGTSAAGQSSSAQLGRQNLAANAASSADSQNRANATAGVTAAALGQNLRENRVGGAFDRSLGLANILSSAVGQSGAAAQAADQEILAASQNYGVAAAQNAANAADQKAARGTQMWMMAFQAGIAMMPKQK